MKVSALKFVAFLAVSILFFSCAEAEKPTWKKIVKAEGAEPALIPLPKTVEWGDSLFVLSAENTICYNQGGETSALWLQELLVSANVKATLKKGDSCGNMNVILDPSLKEQLGEEGYILDIDKKGITLKGATDAGLFYAVETLRQFFPAGIEQKDFSEKEIALRQVHIKDQPQYSWRGNMVDIARSFLGLEYLKNHVDRMAAYKLNRLHLHLTDDQGWRIEIKSRPKLTEIGAKSSVVDGQSGFLTQEEYIELQEYAAARNIIVIPEIDMPGHIYAALRSYPELNCEGTSNINPEMVTYPEPYQKYRVGWSHFCLEKPEVVYDFVGDVIGELASITKGPWIHIGGDEIEHELYEEFVVKADSIVRSYGKTSIGWEEVTQAKVDPSLISQQWHGNTKSIVDTKLIKSICSSFYLDHANVPGQEHTNNWCNESGVSIQAVYKFNTDDEDVLGVEAAVWSEYVINGKRMDDRFWPRNLAVAEVAWTSKDKRDIKSFMKRLNGHSDRLAEMGINYFPTPGVDWRTEEIASKTNTVFSGFMPKK